MNINVTFGQGESDFPVKIGATDNGMDVDFGNTQLIKGDKGDDGISPTVDITPIDGGHRISITDADGTETADVLDGKDGRNGKDGADGYTPVKGVDYFDGDPGADGISPTVAVQDITGGHRVTITDKDGAKTFDVMDGKDGAGGSVGAAVQSDLSVNDPNDPAYVKNRPFYSYTETTLTQAVLASGTYMSEFIADYGVFAAVVMTDSTVEQDEPCYYNVAIDGAEYKNLAKYSPAEGLWLLGNGAILAPLFDAMGIETPADTGEPFVMLVNNDAIWTDVFLITDLVQSTTHEMTLTYCKETSEEIVKKLPRKYYDGVGVRYYVENSERGEIFNTYEGLEKNTASGMNSHAEGNNTAASGRCSHTEGINTTASGEGSHAQGRHNRKDTVFEYAHIVGNGTSSVKLSNAHTLDWDGNAWFSGSVYVGSTSGVNRDEGSMKLVANGDNEIILTSPSGTRYRLTVADDGTLTTAAL